MKPITETVSIKNIEKINAARIQIISAVDELCQKNNLTYFAFGKLLVGIIHYRDFIPNGLKSPVELGMLRKDYAAFEKFVKEQSPEMGFAVNDRNLNGTKVPMLSLEKEVLFESEEAVVSEIVSVKVFAFDYVPDSAAQRKFFFRKIYAARTKYKRISNLTVKDGYVPLKIKEATIIFLNTLFRGKKNPKKSYQKMMNLAQKYDNTKYIRKLLPSWGTLCKVEDIFPVKKMQLGNIEVNCPNNHKLWVVEIDDALMEQTRTIQKIDKVIMTEFDRVCREIGVGYFVCGGTMLGYMRHGGFIPWDDDVDCGMLREDYDKFIQEAPKYLGKDFFLQTRQTDPKIPYLFTKIRMNETEYITTYNEFRDFHKGICLDVFPFDYIPDQANERFKFLREIDTRVHFHNFICNKQLEKPKYDAPAKSIKEKAVRVINEIRRVGIHMIPMKFTQKIYLKKATQYNSKAKEMGLTTVASFVPSYTYAKVTDMIPYQDIDFDGVRLMGLKDMDSFLTMQYGDYMQLPPRHNRVGHDLVRWGISENMADKYHIYEK